MNVNDSILVHMPFIIVSFHSVTIKFLSVKIIQETCKIYMHVFEILYIRQDKLYTIYKY